MITESRCFGRFGTLMIPAFAAFTHLIGKSYYLIPAALAFLFFLHANRCIYKMLAREKRFDLLCLLLFGLLGTIGVHLFAEQLGLVFFQSLIISTLISAGVSCCPWWKTFDEQCEQTAGSA
ncbi:MAG: hypothetical protein KDJ39_01415 [Gammaproteobacteria bacterium]|nr:hypothetical protein [Gammaproteobacteria bacterium]